MGIEFGDISNATDTLVRIPSEDRKTLGNGFATANASLEKLYSILLYDLVNKETIEEPALDPAERTKAAEYFFRLPPKVHEMHEPFSTQITPTQKGGRFIESHGSLIKEIRVQGTTGFRPDALARMVQRPTNNTNTNNLSGVSNPAGAVPTNSASVSQDRSTNEATGFDDIVFLKNVFRLYSDIKHDIQRSSSVVMLWRNVKDGEYWVVEPTDFKVSQSSSGPLTYEYDFQLKTISRLSQAYSYLPDPLTPLFAPRNFQSRINDISNQLTAAFETISNGINTIRRMGVDAVNQILRPILSVLNGLSALKHAGQRLVNFVAVDIVNLAVNVWDAFARLQANTEAAPQNTLANTLKAVGRLASRLGQEEAFKQSINSLAFLRQNRHAEAYTRPGTPLLPKVQPPRGVSNAFIGDQKLTGEIRQDYVRDGEDIRSLAARLLGSRARWHSLVVLNDLRAPYISSAGARGVLRPGDPVVYPTNRGTRGSALTGANQSSQSRDGTDTNREGPIVEAYGRDIRLLSTEVSPYVELTDLTMSQRGDIDTIAGIPNVDQAVRLKFTTEQGELTVHPGYGARFPIGTRATPAAFNTFRIDVESTLRSDRRISQINKLSFQAVGDVISISARLSLINQSDELVTRIEL